MYCAGGSAILCQIVTFQNIENLNQRNSARRGRRSADNFIPAVRTPHSFAFFHFIMGEIVNADQPATFLNECGYLARYSALIESCRIFGDPFQSQGQFRLPKNLSGFVIVAVTLEDTA